MEFTVHWSFVFIILIIAGEYAEEVDEDEADEEEDSLDEIDQRITEIE